MQPIFVRYGCNGCHSGVRPAANCDLSSAAASFAALVGKVSPQCSPRVLVKAFAPAESHLVNKVTGVDVGCGTRMPKSGAGLTALEVDTVRAWIGRGAMND